MRNITTLITLFQSYTGCLGVDPGATRLAPLGACPWLSYFAPLALRYIRSLALRYVLAP